MRFNGNREAVEITGRAGALYDGEKARFLNSFWLFLEPNDNAFTVHWRDGFWEAWITAWLDVQLDHHDIFVDIGANVGYYTFMAADRVDEVIAVEPQSHLVELLEKSKEVNGAPVTIYSCAISDGYGTVELSAPTGHSGAGSIMGAVGDSSHVEQVPAIPFDDIAASDPSNKRWLIKVDAEGAEPLIWAGMKKFRREQTFTMILEWGPSRYEDPRQFADDLLGYDVTMVDTNGDEQPVTKDSLLAVQDFEMIVVRN